MEPLYTIEHDGNMFDWEYEDEAQAVEAAREYFDERCAGMFAPPGTIFDDECVVVEFVINEDTGERVINMRRTLPLGYEETVPDYIEHRTW